MELFYLKDSGKWKTPYAENDFFSAGGAFCIKFQLLSCP